MPKSSMTMRTPRSAMVRRVCTGRPVDCMSTVSVSSSCRLAGSSPVSARACRTSSSSRGSVHWRGETLTLISSGASGWRAPASRRRPGARLAQHPAAQRADHAGLLGDRDERVGRDACRVRVPPAQQRLGAAQPVVGERDEGLVDQLELAALQRARQAVDQIAAIVVERAERRAQDALLVTEDLLLDGPQ